MEKISSELEQKIRGSLLKLPNSNASMDLTVIAKNTPIWKFHRRFLLCGSEISALLGLDPYMSRAALMKSKSGNDWEERDKGELTRRMLEYGDISEAAAIAQLRDIFPNTIMHVGKLRYDFNLVLEGTPDAVTFDSNGDWIPIEIKTRAYPDPYGAVPYVSKYDVPYKHWVQIFVYMLLLDSNEGFLVNYSATNGTKVFWLKMNHAFILEFLLPTIENYMNGFLPQRVLAPERRPLLDFMSRMVADDKCCREMSIREIRKLL